MSYENVTCPSGCEKHTVVISRDSNHLEHFGIKGQKWGVRRFENLDGTLTEAGKERYNTNSERKALADKVQKTVHKGKGPTNWSEINKASREVREHPVVRDIVHKVKGSYDLYKKADNAVKKEERAFYNDEKTYEKYLNKAVDNFMKYKGEKNGWTRESVYNWFKNDDGDQGERSSIELYKRSPEGKKLVGALKNAHDAYSKYIDTCRSYVSEYLGAYGDERISYGGSFDNYSRSVTSQLVGLITFESL